MTDFLFLTICSLRYDVAQAAMNNGDTPNLKRLLGEWEKRETPGTFTLPAHIAFFSGRTPRPLAKSFPDGIDSTERLFALSTKWEQYKGRNIRYFFEDAPNVPRGFEGNGYNTIGVGGVGWFNTNYQSSSFWGKTHFQQFLFDDEYGPRSEDGFARQITDLKQALTMMTSPRFIFVNAATCHMPYIYRKSHHTFAEGQTACLSYIDSQIPNLLEVLKPGSPILICADHGDCHGEDGLRGHGFVHENVLTVPYAETVL